MIWDYGIYKRTCSMIPWSGIRESIKRTCSLIAWSGIRDSIKRTCYMIPWFGIRKSIKRTCSMIPWSGIRESMINLGTCSMINHDVRIGHSLQNPAFNKMLITRCYWQHYIKLRQNQTDDSKIIKCIKRTCSMITFMVCD